MLISDHISITAGVNSQRGPYDQILCNSDHSSTHFRKAGKSEDSANYFPIFWRRDFENELEHHARISSNISLISSMISKKSDRKKLCFQILALKSSDFESGFVNDLICYVIQVGWTPLEWCWMLAQFEEAGYRTSVTLDYLGSDWNSLFKVE